MSDYQLNCFHQTLNHLRFSRFVVLVEKWMSIIILIFLKLAGFQHFTIFCCLLLLLLTYFIVSRNHQILEDTAGVPNYRMQITL